MSLSPRLQSTSWWQVGGRADRADRMTRQRRTSAPRRSAVVSFIAVSVLIVFFIVADVGRCTETHRTHRADCPHDGW